MQPGGQGPPGQPPGGGGGRRGPENPLRDPDTFMDTLAGMTAQYLEHQRAREEREGRLAGLTPEQIQQQQRIQQEVEQNRAIGFTLNPDEMAQIISSPENARQVVEGWLSAMEANEQFFTSEGANHILENKVNISIAWLIYLKYPQEEGATPEQLALFQKEKRDIMEEATVRMDLHNIKRAIGQADLKLIGEFATKIGMHGLMNGFNIKHTQLAFNMYQRYFERHLYNYGKLKANEEKEIKSITGVFKDRISPQLINNAIRREVRDDLINNRELYGLTEEEALIAERIGYSLFSASQRKGVHVSRGTIIAEDFDEDSTHHRWFKTQGFTSDPDEILDNLYNPLEFQLRKWSRPSKAQTKVLNEIMTFMGEGDLAAGEQRFIDSSYLADLFTSGWRIGYILESIKRRAEAHKLSGENSETEEQFASRVQSIATAMRLKAGSGHTAKEDGIKKQLGNVAKYRPLELLKTYVVDIDRHAHQYKTKSSQTEALRKKLRDMFDRGEFTSSGGTHKIAHYVELEEVLGRYIYPIYEKGMQGATWNNEQGKFESGGWSRMRGIDIGKPYESDSIFAEENRTIITKVVEHINRQIETSGDQRAKDQMLTPDELINLYQKVQDFIGSAEAKDDIFKGRTLQHSQLFARTLYLDDVPLDKLSQQDQLSPDKVDLGLAGKFNDVRGGGRDSYRRIWNDTSSAFEANSEFMKAINSTKTDQLFESLMKGSHAMSGYGGKEPALELAYNVAGGWLKLALGDSVWRWIALHDKLPIKTSELERLFGEGAASLSLEETHHLVENLKLIFGDMTKDDHRVTHAFEHAEKALGISKARIWLSRSYIIMFVLALAAMAKLTDEIAEAIKEE